ncbi:MAG TPA: VanZ family protein [Paenisporosarcina sp.]|nr:VanZ family protein [Paenisporosarcina sp.]
MDSILRYIEDMSFYMVIILPVIIVIRIFQIIKSGKKTRVFRELGIILFFMFLTGLLSQTILPAVSIQGGSIKLINGDHQAINLEPFRVISETYNAIKYLNLWQPFFINFVGNIVMFIPIGVLLPLLWKRFDRAWRTIGTGFLLSVSIELLQLPQMRSSDVDDLWLNTLGASIGYILYKKFLNNFKKSFNRKQAG